MFFLEENKTDGQQNKIMDEESSVFFSGRMEILLQIGRLAALNYPHACTVLYKE
jgi:hypothetical protein